MQQIIVCLTTLLPFLYQLPTGLQQRTSMYTMKPLLSKHRLLLCALWLLACCTGAACKDCKDYRRVMWVSTTGEDSPQCILDSPAGDPAPYTLQPCRSLNYALTNIRSETVIGIACGIHVLEPVGSCCMGHQW